MVSTPPAGYAVLLRPDRSVTLPRGPDSHPPYRMPPRTRGKTDIGCPARRSDPPPDGPRRAGATASAYTQARHRPLASGRQMQCARWRSEGFARWQPCAATSTSSRHPARICRRRIFREATSVTAFAQGTRFNGCGSRAATVGWRRQRRGGESRRRRPGSARTRERRSLPTWRCSGGVRKPEP